MAFPSYVMKAQMSGYVVTQLIPELIQETVVLIEPED